MFVSQTRDKVAELLAAGLRLGEIARQLDLAPQTISYHAKQIRDGAVDERHRTPTVVELDESARHRPTRELVRELLAEGHSRADIARSLGITKSTVSFHARRLGAEIDETCARRYDWQAVQRYHDEGHGMRDCAARFGFCRASWHAARRRGDLVTRPACMTVEELFVAGTHRSRHNLKLRLLDGGLKAPACEVCGIDEWLGSPLSLALHHRNGDRLDNRLQNLELLCPNCHSQTENFSGRNGRRRSA
jgi:DNA-binding CsgD family transcriptional regulator